MRDREPDDGDTIDEIDEGMRQRAERERGEEPAPDSLDDWHPLTCGYYFAFAEDADAMCDCGFVARRKARTAEPAPDSKDPDSPAWPF